MPKAYVIVDIDVTDPAAYEEYKTAAAPAVTEYGGTYIVRGGPTEVLEGDRVPKRTVILEFPDVASGRAWYHSPEYTAARKLREGAATGSLILVEGV